MPMSRRGKATLKKTIIIMSIIVAILVFSFAIFFGYKHFFSGSEETVEEKTTSQEVSVETMDRLSTGTVLSFGNPEKKHISIIADPGQISRSSGIINGKPSDILTAVNDGDIYLNLYLYPSSPERSQAVDSVIKAATCRLGSESSDTGIFTLNGIVKAGAEISGDESIEDVAVMMGMETTSDCPATSNEAALSTANNTQYFMTHFNLDSPGALISHGFLITNIEEMNDDWVSRAKEGAPATELSLR